MRIAKEQMFMKFAKTAAKRSTCKRLQVGAIITNHNMTNVLAIGYNGNYSGGANTCDSDEPGLCGCIHSENNALIKPRMPDDAIMFITDSPCVACAKLIVNAGINVVYYEREYRIIDGLTLLKVAGVEVKKILT